LEDEFKYIQYIPKAGGRNDHGLDRAIRQLYVPREHPRVKPASPTKHGGFEQMFIRKPGNRADQEFEDSIDQASANSFSVNVKSLVKNSTRDRNSSNLIYTVSKFNIVTRTTYIAKVQPKRKSLI